MRSSGLDANRPLPPQIHPMAPVVRKQAEEINGATITVRLGQSLVVSTPPQPAGPFAWRVISVDRTLSQPQVGREGEPTSRAGAKFSTTFTWKVGGPLIKAGGEHQVTLGYGTKTIAFKVLVAR